MASEMPKALKRWETIRQKGKMRFILENGVLMWGVPMFVVMTFLVNPQKDRQEHKGSLILISAVIWAIGGLLFGWTVWTISEKRYQKFLAAQQVEPPNPPPG